MDTAAFAAIATSLETVAGASTSANATIPGYCKRIALACESIAGASTTANAGEAGWLLRAAVALEAKEGTSPAGYNRGVEGLLARIVAALEHKTGASVGSILKRMQVAATAYTVGGGGGPTALAVADFKNGVYSIGGVSKTLADMVTSDVDWAPDWDPAYVVGGTGWRTVGLGGNNVAKNGVLTPAVIAALTPSFVVVLTSSITIAVAANAQALVQTFFTNGSDGWHLDQMLAYDNSSVFLTGNTATYDGSSAFAFSDFTTSGVHKTAALFSAAELAISTDGAAIGDASPAQTNAGANIFLVTVGANQTNTAILQKIEIWSGYAASDLPALSA